MKWVIYSENEADQIFFLKESMMIKTQKHDVEYRLHIVGTQYLSEAKVFDDPADISLLIDQANHARYVTAVREVTDKELFKAKLERT